MPPPYGAGHNNGKKTKHLQIRSRVSEWGLTFPTARKRDDPTTFRDTALHSQNRNVTPDFEQKFFFDVTFKHNILTVAIICK